MAAAQAGDRLAAERLVRDYLPLVYNVVGRASPLDVNALTAVQQTMLLVMRGVPGLSEPEQFQTWLVTAAVRAVRAAERTQQVPAPDFAELTIRSLDVSGQRREAVEATRWLGEEDRALLSLWWLEVAGWLTRADLVAASGQSLADVAIRTRQVEGRFEDARSVVRALTASPRCGQLKGLVSLWDGRPSDRQRRHLARHIRACSACLKATGDLKPVDRLLAGFPLVPPPSHLADRLLTPGAGTASRGLADRSTARLPSIIRRLPWSAVARRYPILARNTAVMVAVAMLIGALASYVATRPALPEPAVRSTSLPAAATTEPQALATSTDSPVARPVAGRHSLRSATNPQLYVQVIGDLTFLAPISSTSPAATKRQATFEIVPGLANPACYSFRDSTNQYLRHSAFRVRIDADNRNALLRKDATFCARTGSSPQSVTFQSLNYPDRYLRFRDDDELWIDRADTTEAFWASASFVVAAPWA